MTGDGARGKTKRPADRASVEARLDPLAFEVTQCGGTERAFTGKFWDHHERGSYLCVCCGETLFGSTEKFDSGSGWPSFFAPLEGSRVATSTDSSHGMVRTEVRCSACGAHLGHVFDDGPRPTGLRYCINSAALDFDPEA